MVDHQQDPGIDVDRLVRTAVLLIAAAAMVWASFQQDSLLLSSRVRWRSQAGGIALALLAVIDLLRAVAAARQRYDRRDGQDHGHTHRHGRPRLWPLLLPLVLFPAAVRSDMATLARNKRFLPGAESVATVQPGTPVPSVPDVSADDDTPESPATLAELLDYQPGDLPMDATTVLTEETFFEITEIAMENPEFVRGRRFRLTGFVYREFGWPENEFVVSRLLIWCCAADATLVGMYARTDDVPPPNDTWVEIEGIVDVIPDFQTVAGDIIEMPFVAIESLRIIDEPEQVYVLPPF